MMANWWRICEEGIDPAILKNHIRPAPNLLCATKQRKFAQGMDENGS
jgi:hypothetical protein